MVLRAQPLLFKRQPLQGRCRVVVPRVARRGVGLLVGHAQPSYADI